MKEIRRIRLPNRPCVWRFGRFLFPEFYSGSPALSALAAFKAGADMVRVLAPKPGIGKPKKADGEKSEDSHAIAEGAEILSEAAGQVPKAPAAESMNTELN